MAQTWANDQSMLTQAPSPSLPSASPMQLLRSKASFEQMMGANADAFAHIATKLEQYAALPANNRTGKQNMLANIETKIYQWLAANHDSKDEKAMHVLMNDVQAEHVAVIRAVEANNETPQWMSDEAQPADYAQLWADLVAGRGSLTFTDQDHAAMLIYGRAATVANFRAEMLSAFARIMSMPKGLTLIRNLMAHPLPTLVIPKTEAAHKIMQAVGGNDDHKESPGIASSFPRSMTPRDVKDALALSSQNVNQHGGITNGHLGAGGLPIGSRAIVALDPGLQDGRYDMLNKDGKPIPCPIFVMLAHELQHAEHIVKGQNTRHVKQLGPDYNPFYPNMEELDTIERDPTSENAIREEHFIETRKGHAAQLYAKSHHHPQTGVVQMAPKPVKPNETSKGSAYVDDELGIRLTKLNGNNGFLYNESRILYWDGHQYLNQANAPVNPKDLKDDGQRILDVTQGELGWVKHKNNPNGYTHLRTSNASPCIILIIHNRLDGKSLMAHIHRGNDDDQIKQMMNNVPDEKGIAVHLVTLAYTGTNAQEQQVQQARMKYLVGHFSTMRNITFTKTENQENATLDIASGAVTHHADGSGPEDLSLLGVTRAITKEKEFQASPDKPVLFDVRAANVEDVSDDVYEHIKVGKTSGEIFGSI